MNYSMCLWCLSTEDVAVVVQPDRPCPRCRYMGDWDGTPVFTHPPVVMLAREARIAAAHDIDRLMWFHDQPRMN